MMFLSLLGSSFRKKTQNIKVDNRTIRAISSMLLFDIYIVFYVHSLSTFFQVSVMFAYVQPLQHICCINTVALTWDSLHQLCWFLKPIHSGAGHRMCIQGHMHTILHSYGTHTSTSDHFLQKQTNKQKGQIIK